jgi:hypothetical protein
MAYPLKLRTPDNTGREPTSDDAKGFCWRCQGNAHCNRSRRPDRADNLHSHFADDEWKAKIYAGEIAL